MLTRLLLFALLFLTTCTCAFGQSIRFDGDYLKENAQVDVFVKESVNLAADGLQPKSNVTLLVKRGMIKVTKQEFTANEDGKMDVLVKSIDYELDGAKAELAYTDKDGQRHRLFFTLSYIKGY